MASPAAQSFLDGAQLPDGSGLQIGIVTSTWNAEITGKLRDACLYTLQECGVEADSIISISVPGAFELPLAAKLMIDHRLPDAVICLGCIIKGETRHDEYIASSLSQNLMALGLETDTPVIFGVLTTENEEQALDRAGGKHGNKGVEAAISAVHMVNLAMEMVESSESLDLFDDDDDDMDELGEMGDEDEFKPPF